MTSTPILLLDTNVWIDGYCGDHPHGEAAKRLLSLGAIGVVNLAYATTSVKDVFYVLTHEFKRMARAATGELTESQAAAALEGAWGCVNNMAEIASAVGVDQGDVWIARKQRHLHDDLEDNLVAAAAYRANATYLVSSDQRFVEHLRMWSLSPLVALSPEDMVTVLEERFAS